MSSNAASPNIDPTEFTERHGYAPQEFANRVAVSQARAPKLAAETKELATLKAALVPGGWENLTDQSAMKAGAAAENAYLAQVQIVHGLQHQQKQALAFAHGEIEFGSYRSDLGKTVNQLIDNDLVDGDAVRAAINAAL